MNNFVIRMGSKDSRYALVTGKLISATDQSDIDYVFNRLVKDFGWTQENAHYSLFDKRNGKPRKHRYKLIINQIILRDKVFYGDVNPRTFKF